MPVSDQRMRQRALLSLSTFSDADVCGRGNTLQKRSVSSPAAPAPRHHQTIQNGHASPTKTTLCMHHYFVFMLAAMIRSGNSRACGLAQMLLVHCLDLHSHPQQ